MALCLSKGLGRIAQVLGGRRPEGLIYELFLDEKGEKISKSKGNGLTIEQWRAEVIFELGDLLAHRRLADVQGSSRLGEASLADDFDEAAQLLEFHGLIPIWNDDQSNNSLLGWW